MKKGNQTSFCLSIFALALLSISSAYAAGYKVVFQSASTLADAGDAAIAHDASTNWYNAAGLVYIPQQFMFSLFDVYAPVHFSGTSTAPAAVGPSYSARGHASSHPNQPIPALHYAQPMACNWSIGLSVAPAWGFMEDYGRHSLVRYNLHRIKTRSIDIAPSAAFKVTPQFSIGFGPDFNYFSVDSKNSVLTPIRDSISQFKAHDWGYGGHIGALYRFNDATRVGLNYRSRITMKLDGDSDFFLGTTNTNFSTNNFKLKVPLPPVTVLSIYHDVNPNWALTGTLSYEQWSVINHYRANNLMSPTGPIPVVILPQDMRNTLEGGVGTLYKFNDCWTLRGAIKYLPTPTRSEHRGLSFPDGAKLGLQVGARYQYTKNIALDGIYGHVFVRKAHIDDLNPVTFAHSVGTSKAHVDFAGVQMVWDI